MQSCLTGGTTVGAEPPTYRAETVVGGGTFGVTAGDGDAESTTPAPDA